MTPQSQADLDYLMDSYNTNYPKRFIAGSKKYNTLLSDKSALQNAFDTREELWDGIAYINFNIQKLEKVRTRLTALKEQLQENVYTCIQNNESLELLEEVYDPIRRIDAIMDILYGQEG